jgi:hypothetical protein
MAGLVMRGLGWNVRSRSAAKTSPEGYPALTFAAISLLSVDSVAKSVLEYEQKSFRNFAEICAVLRSRGKRSQSFNPPPALHGPVGFLYLISRFCIRTPDPVRTPDASKLLTPLAHRSSLLDLLPTIPRDVNAGQISQLYPVKNDRARHFREHEPSQTLLGGLERTLGGPFRAPQCTPPMFGCRVLV